MKSLALILALLLAVPAATRADDPPEIPGESARLTRRLDELSRNIEAARKDGDETTWRELLDEMQALITGHANELVAVEKDRAVQVRRACHELLGHLPSEALILYRQRWDAQAKKWLDEGKRKRDARLLRRVVDDAFATEAARDALELLGDLAFEQGRFEEASSWWRYLSRLHPARESVETAMAARQLLARWFDGGSQDREAWEASRQAFLKRYPDKQGYLAGKKDDYGKRLEAIMKEVQPDRPEARCWPTFGGADDRNRILPPGTLVAEPLGRLLQDGSRHSFRLLDKEADTPRTVTSPSEAARYLAFHPIIVNDRIFVADARKVHALDAATAKAEVWFDLAALDNRKKVETIAAPDVRCTLTATTDSVLARLGATDKEEKNYLICLNHRADEKGQRLRWKAVFEGEFVEGSPLVDRERVYAVVNRTVGVRAITSVYCYPLKAENDASPLWKSDVSTHGDPENSRIPPSRLLTRGGSHLFFCTHGGTVVALDADSGRLSWGARYRRERVSDTAPHPSGVRDVNPCVYSDGRLYVAPTDSDVLLCLDALNGRILWERDRIEVTHLLGAARDRLIFTTRTPKPGLRAVALVDGSDRGGWFQAGEGTAFHTFGRGLLAGDVVIWPTLRHVYLVRTDDGTLAADPSLTSRLPSGNIIYGAGTLLIAGREEMRWFTPAR